MKIKDKKNIIIKIAIIIAIIMSMTNIAVADSVPPSSVSSLKNITYQPNYINWTWKDPTDSDFSKVMVYINGNFKTNVSKGKRYYNATGLTANKSYKIGTRTVDTSGNINQTWKNHSARTARDYVAPKSISNLHDISFAPDYINWTWNNPSDIDFEKVMVYINGKFQTNVSKSNKYYDATGLIANKTYKIGTRTVDTSGNINQTWKNHSAKTTDGHKEIRFITVGDPHIDDASSIEQKRLKEVIKYTNTTDANFTIVMGDITQDGSWQEDEFNISDNILDDLIKYYYVIPGNHDVKDYNQSNYIFERHYGSMEKITKINGYQLLFVGIWKEVLPNGTKIYHWSFNFSKANKYDPTIVFIHGAVKSSPPGYPCTWSEGGYFRYASSMQKELDKFTKLIGVYSGHVHGDTNQIFATSLVPNVRYTTINGLVDIDIGCQNVKASNKVGYSIIRDGKLNYNLVPYIDSTNSLVSENRTIYYKKDIDSIEAYTREKQIIRENNK